MNGSPLGGDFDQLPAYPAYTFKESAVKPEITEQLSFADGSVVDLSDAETVKFYLQHYRTGAMVVDGKTATITDVANGEVKYEVGKDTLTFGGPYAGAFVVLWPEGTTEHPVETYLRIDVADALSSGDALNPDTDPIAEERGPPGPVGPRGPSVAIGDDGTRVIDTATLLNFTDSIEVVPKGDGSGEAEIRATGALATVSVEDDGNPVVPEAGTLNFGPNLTVTEPTNGEAKIQANFNDTNTHVLVKDESGTLATRPDTIVIGDNLSVSETGTGTVRIDGTGGGGGGGGTPPIPKTVIYDEQFSAGDSATVTYAKVPKGTTFKVYSFQSYQGNDIEEERVSAYFNLIGTGTVIEFHSPADGDRDNPIGSFSNAGFGNRTAPMKITVALDGSGAQSGRFLGNITYAVE